MFEYYDACFNSSGAIIRSETSHNRNLARKDHLQFGRCISDQSRGRVELTKARSDLFEEIE